MRASVHELIASGQTPFFRAPVTPIHAGPVSADVVIAGVPYDGGTTYRPGARFGPYHVRRMSMLVESFHPGLGFDPFARLNVVDGGNVMAPPFSGDAMREIVAGSVSAMVAAGARPFLVGGDHSITLPALRALAKVHGPLAVVHFDAHHDTSDGQQWGVEHHHGTPIRHALMEGLVSPGGLIQIGLRGPWKASDDADLVRAHDARRIDADEVAERGPKALAEEVRARVGSRPTYVTFDIDAVDPAFAPGTGTPVPGGITAREALALVRGLAGLRWVGMDLVEVAPDLDHADITSLLAAHLLYEGLCAAAA